jgi:hypothetical protein
LRVWTRKKAISKENDELINECFNVIQELNQILGSLAISKAVVEENPENIEEAASSSFGIYREVETCRTSDSDEREERELNSENSEHQGGDDQGEDDQGDHRRDEREDKEEQEEQDREGLDMSAFSYDSAVKLPELKTLGSEETRDFLNAVEGYHSILNADGKGTLIGFVYRTKITGKAKTRLGEQEDETLEELRAKVQSLSSATESIESLLKKLENCRTHTKKLFLMQTKKPGLMTYIHIHSNCEIKIFYVTIKIWIGVTKGLYISIVVILFN